MRIDRLAHEWVIQDLADGEATYLDRLVDMTCERDAYRNAYLASLERLHQTTMERDAERRQRLRLHSELQTSRGGRAA